MKAKLFLFLCLGLTLALTATACVRSVNTGSEPATLPTNTAEPAGESAAAMPPASEPGMPTATQPLTGTLPAEGQENLLCAYPQGWAPYTVQGTDSLESLAAVSGITAGELATSNCLYATSGLQAGMVIYLPPAAGAPEGETSATNGSESTSESNKQEKKASCKSPYTVRGGEWVYKIARRCNISPDAIIAYNNLAYPYLLRPGQVLKLPPNAPPFPGN